MIWRKNILTKLFILIGFNGAFATPQVSNMLIYNGDTISVYLNILPDDFYKLDTVRINTFEHVNHILTVNLFGNKNTCWSTACGDGYKASWEIDNNQLYLTGIYSCCYYEDSIKADLDLLFKEKVINGRVKADWISTENIVRGGDELTFFSQNIIPVFKNEIEFVFNEGKLMNIKTFDNSKSRHSTFRQDEKKMLNFIYTNIDWDNLPKQQMPVRVIIRFSANEDGKVDEVEIMRKSDNEIFNQEAVRVIKLIPDWDVLFLYGQLFREWYNIPITFSEENRKKYGK